MNLALKKEIQLAKDLAESARELLAATTDSAEDKVRQARARLGVAVESSREVFDRLSDRASTAAKVADSHLRDHPYVPVIVALGLGALLAIVLLRENPHKNRPEE
ncbi:MAG: hypothetical protein WC003_05255 [Terrimicrobiaceae bacterium]